jgi:hypothetical protein
MIGGHKSTPITDGGYWAGGLGQEGEMCEQGGQEDDQQHRGPKLNVEHDGHMLERPEKYIAEALRPITEFKKYVLYVGKCSRKRILLTTEGCYQRG